MRHPVTGQLLALLLLTGCHAPRALVRFAAARAVAPAPSLATMPTEVPETRRLVVSEVPPNCPPASRRHHPARAGAVATPAPPAAPPAVGRRAARRLAHRAVAAQPLAVNYGQGLGTLLLILALLTVAAIVALILWPLPTLAVLVVLGLVFAALHHG